MPSKEYVVKTTSTRELHISKLDDGNYQVKLYWGKGGRDLATLVIPPREWNKLASVSEGLKRK
jgi:hypothetical protein